MLLNSDGGDQVSVADRVKRIVAQHKAAHELKDKAQEEANALAQELCPHKIGDELIVDEALARKIYSGKGKRIRCVNVIGTIYGPDVHWRAVFAILNVDGEPHARRHSIGYSVKIT